MRNMLNYKKNAENIKCQQQQMFDPWLPLRALNNISEIVPSPLGPICDQLFCLSGTYRVYMESPGYSHQ